MYLQKRRETGGPGLAFRVQLLFSLQSFSFKLSISAPAFSTPRPAEVAEHYSSGCRPTPTTSSRAPGGPVGPRPWPAPRRQSRSRNVGPAGAEECSGCAATATGTRYRWSSLPLRLLFLSLVFRAPPLGFSSGLSFCFILEVLS